MDNHETIEQLPEDLEVALQSLGGVSAPEELWHRVALSMEEHVEAPDELWDRIAPEVAVAARPVRRFRLRHLSAAAAILIIAAIGLLPEDPISTTQPTAQLYIEAHNQLRDQYAAKVLSREVLASELSAVSRAFAAAAGANPVSGSLH